MKYIIFLVNETTIMVLGGWGGKGPLDSTEVFHIFSFIKTKILCTWPFLYVCNAKLKLSLSHFDIFFSRSLFIYLSLFPIYYF